MTDREQLERAIAAQEQLRGMVDDDVIDAAITSLRAQLAAAERSGQRRRQVTVLFADVQGFTALAESLDPEVVADMMNNVWDRLDSIITEHGGRIDKHIGDAVMAVWGAEVSREDDPERAVRAALALQQALGTTGAATDRRLTMRVGVSTGLALLGAVGRTSEFTAMGDTVNVASRLEHAAPAGGVLITHDTYRHIRGVFDVSPLPPMSVKGKANLLSVYVVHGAKPHAFRTGTRGVEGVETRMVGRDAELQALRDAYQRARQVGLEVVTLLGEPGVGKSRMLYEFENWIDLLDRPVYYLKARALATAQTVPYGVFRNLLATRFGILDTDSPGAVAAKLHEGFSPHLGVSEAELVGHWLGFDLSASSAVQRLKGSASFVSVCSAHLVRYLGSLAEHDATLIVLEDLHWADEESLDLLHEALARLGEARLLVVGAARPALLDRRPGWLEAVPAATTVRLSAFPPSTTRALVAEVLQKVPDVPEELVQLIVHRADGNPYFVEELVKMLVEDGVIVRDDEAWTTDLERLDRARVPSTLTGVLEARLDSLSPSGRSALQRASVIGRVFWDAAVAALAPAAPAVETASGLATARERELVYRAERSSLDAGTEYFFKHALLRDATYETVLLRDRRRLHELAARWLTDHAGARLAEFLEVIADHERLAGDPVAAATLLWQAGKRALDTGNSVTARRSLERAMALLAEASLDVPGDVRLWLAEACCRIGDLDAAEAAAEPVLQQQADDRLEAEAIYLLSWTACERGDHVRERALLERAQPLAEALGGEVLIKVLLGKGWCEAAAGDMAKTRACSERALSLAVAAEHAVHAGAALGQLAMVEIEEGQSDKAERLIERSLSLARDSGDLEAEARAQSNLGVLFHLRGDADGSLADYEAALRCYRSNMAINSRLGMSSAMAYTGANLAQVSLRLGDKAAARHELAVAMEATLRLGLRDFLAFCLIVAAELGFAGGDSAGALTLLGAVRDREGRTSMNQEEIGRVLDRFALDPDVVAAGMAAGSGRDIEGLAHETLGWLAEGTPVIE